MDINMRLLKTCARGVDQCCKTWKGSHVYITFQCLKNDYSIYIADDGVGGDPIQLH